MSKIRNFCIISHIDHGKSTLADRLLEVTKTVEQRKMHSQFLDMMDIEKEKGITIKLQPVRMEYGGYSLNLIDTPGHVDFSYEVSRSLAAVEGAILLVDASQGVQAQTLANFHLAREQGLKIIPVVNKIDLPQAMTKETVQELNELLNTDEKETLQVSAKQGINIDKVLEAIVQKIPGPTDFQQNPLRALVFDSEYDPYRGILAYVRIVDGQLKAGDKIEMMASREVSEVIEVGLFKPQMTKADLLKSGEIGYVATGLKDVGQCRVGDTIGAFPVKGLPLSYKPLPGYQEPKPMVFASFYPIVSNDYDMLKDGLGKLKLSDASFQYEPESCQGLGRGFRAGFLGMLHLEIVLERLKREHQLNLIVASPSVSYQITDKQGKFFTVNSASDLSKPENLKEIKEPWAELKIVLPSRFQGPVMKLLKQTRGQYRNTEYLSSEKIVLKYRTPLSEIIIDFYDQLKNITAGYASMNYQITDYQPADLVKMDILIAGEKTEVFARIVHKADLEKEARFLVKKLKEVIPKQLFAVSLQAAVDGKIIARENISALRKDVTGYLYGGDYTRKRKLLEKQKKGKKRMKAIGKINLPQEVFFKVLKK
jgi:GTP-binding protein LepA